MLWPSSLRLSLLAIAFLSSGAAWATPVAITNHSFESPATGPGTFIVWNASGPSGWSVYNTGATNTDRSFGVWNPTGTPSYGGNNAPDGANIGVVFLQNTVGIAEAGFEQTLAATLQLSTHYTLTVEVGNFSPPAPYNFTGFPGYRVELLVGNTVLVQDNNTLTPGEGIFATSIRTYDSPTIADANIGQPLRIRLINLNGPGTEVNFDNVRLDAAPVPEPSAALLGSVGALCILGRLRAKRDTAR